MALHLNFYHEIQKQKLQRQRDPLKIGIMVLLFIAMGFIAYYLWNMDSVRRAKNELARVQTEWEQISPKEKAAVTRAGELDQAKKLADSLTHKVENRFYWAPLLEQVMGMIPPDVQITGFSADMTDAGTKKISIVLNGIASGNDPRSVADALRTSIPIKLGAHYQQASAVFGDLQDGLDMQIQGKSQHTATFVINITMAVEDINEAAKAADKPVRRSKS